MAPYVHSVPSCNLTRCETITGQVKDMTDGCTSTDGTTSPMRAMPSPTRAMPTALALLLFENFGDVTCLSKTNPRARQCPRETISLQS